MDRVRGLGVVPTRPETFRPHHYQTPSERKADVDKRRGSSAQRGYDAKWQRLRRRYLMQHPLCECDDCKASGAFTPAEVVDHIKSIKERPDLRLEWSNLRSMSKAHHDRRTAKEQGFAKR